MIIALVVMVAIGVLVAGVVQYAGTSNATVRSYRTARTERYAGDSALKGAVNWVATNYLVGRDPKLGLGGPPCISQQSVVTNGHTEQIKVSCKADEFGGSGKPTEVGQSNPEALLMLSDRLGEPGPYNAAACTGWFDSIAGFFTSGYPDLSSNESQGRIVEPGGFFNATQGLGTLGAGCTTVSRQSGNLRAVGDVVAKSRIRVVKGQLTSQNGKVYATDTSCPNVNPGGCLSLVNDATRNRSGQTGAMAYLNGTNKGTDPGRSNPSSPNANSLADIAGPYVPVGFNSDGTPSGSLPVRTTAYLWDAANNAPGAATGDCVGTSPTIVFLPGWYRNATTLNKYTTSANCKDVTFWFAPDPGADGKYLTADDVTGAFYMDFRQGSASSCRNGANSKSRWCIGNASDANNRVVVGTPKGWSPQGSYTAAGGAGNPPARIHVNIGDAGTVDQNLSASWFSTSGNGVASDARKIDNVAARYHADNYGILFGCGGLIPCFSVNRDIRNRDFTPKVTGPPIDEAAVATDPVAAPRGRVYVTVNYGVTNPTAASSAQAVIQAVSPSSGRKDCGPGANGSGAYTLYGNSEAPSPFNNRANADYNVGTHLHTYTFTAKQARQLANVCGTVDLINGLEIRVQVTGNSQNRPTTDWYFDGVSISYDTFPGANFPNPTGSGSTSSDVAAKSDCDPDKAGGQLIFGGDSHVYVADGSLEVCAGPYPVGTSGSVEDHVNNGIYELPSLAEVGRNTSIAPTKGGDATSISNSPAGVDAVDGNPVTINYPGGCSNLPWTGTKTCTRDGQLNVPMSGYTPPSGYKIQKITARLGYNPKNFCIFGSLFNCPTGTAPQLQTPGCGSVSFPKHTDANLQVASGSNVLMYDSDGSGNNPTKNCLGVSGGVLPNHTITWHARAGAFCVVYICSGASSDKFDGIVYQITLVPTDDNSPLLIPASGCIVTHPNYNSGVDAPDCALVKATLQEPGDNYTLPWNSKEAQWRGRVSVRGGIYAPSAPIEVDDTDVAYPLATRGVVLRHLRITGFANRTNYSGPAIDTTIVRKPLDRDVTFTACVQVGSATTDPCSPSAGDKILSRARVHFTVNGGVNPLFYATPSIQWWAQDR